MKIFGNHDERTIRQLQTCLNTSEGSEGVLCADAHLGYSMPIGGVVSYVGDISPSGVGFDIACGNMAVKTPIKATDLKESDWKNVAREINRRVSFGVGQKNGQKITDHAVFDRIAHSPVVEQRDLLPLAQSQLGTVGSGNHYVDVLIDTDGFVWVANHFGSRGFGHKTATGFMNLGLGRAWVEGSGQGEMDSPPILLPLSSPLGQDYLEAMKIAGEYAYAGREWVVFEVLQILGIGNTGQLLDSVHNHHNFAWMEQGRMVVRKGATPLFPDQRGFVGGSMGGRCAIIKGLDTPLAKEALFSAPHGAGRVLSRTQAAGKIKKKRVWQCSRRECEYFSILTISAKDFKRGGHGELPICPHCQQGKMRQHFVEIRKSAGVVDWDWWKQQLQKSGIILVGGGADEAPQCYRKLEDVLEQHKEHVRVETWMTPKIVVMAGSDTYDPYKD